MSTIISRVVQSKIQSQLLFFVFDFEQGNFPIVIDEADNHEVNSKQLVNVTCLPLYSILMALDNPSIGLYPTFLDSHNICVKSF